MGNSCLRRRRRRREANDVYSHLFRLQLLTGMSMDDPSGGLLEQLVADHNDPSRLRLSLRLFIEHFSSSTSEMLVKVVLLQLHTFCQQEGNYLVVVKMLLEEVPLDQSLACCIINLILSDGCLPTKELATDLMRMLDFDHLDNKPALIQRNSLLIVVAFSDKLIGHLSSSLFTPELMLYICRKLKEVSKLDAANATLDYLRIIVSALLALHVFLITRELKEEVIDQLQSHMLNVDNNSEDLVSVLMKLEALYSCTSYGPIHEIGSLSLLFLDNYVDVPDRRCKSHETLGRHNLNVILSTKDCTEAIKVFPTGLEVRSDAFSFESIRSTFPVVFGAWYYEVTLVTDGIMQIGFTTKNSKFFSHEGYGVGDDKESIGIDGCRCCIWYNAEVHSQCYNESHLSRWSSGDVIGCYIDVERTEVRFSINGKWCTPLKQIFSAVTASATPPFYYAAVSLMSNQQCTFNFGRTPFRYSPPNSCHRYQRMNDEGKLSDQDRLVLPWLDMMRKRKELAMATDYSKLCLICADREISVTLQPCGHDGFCDQCPKQLADCPLCRGVIESWEEDKL